MGNAVLDLFVNLCKRFAVFVLNKKGIITESQGAFFFIEDHSFSDSLDAFFHSMGRGKSDPTFIIALSSRILDPLHFFEEFASVVFVGRVFASIPSRTNARRAIKSGDDKS